MKNKWTNPVTIRFLTLFKKKKKKKVDILPITIDFNVITECLQNNPKKLWYKSSYLSLILITKIKHCLDFGLLWLGFFGGFFVLF